MPAPIPAHLGHLRTDPRGIPVPVVNLWGDQADRSRWSVQPDPLLEDGRRLGVWFDDDPDGLPDFRRQSPQRQRACMLGLLCQVCGDRITDSLWLPVHPGSLQPITVDGGPPHLLDGRTMVTTEPWVHQACGLFAVARCPALLEAERSGAWRLHPVLDPDAECQVIVSSGTLDGHPETITNPPAMFVKLALLGVDYRQADHE